MCKTKQTRFLMSKQKNEALVHLVPSELSLFFITLVKKTWLLLLFPKTSKQACNAETMDQQQTVHIHWSTQMFLGWGERIDSQLLQSILTCHHGTIKDVSDELAITFEQVFICNSSIQHFEQKMALFVSFGCHLRLFFIT